MCAMRNISELSRSGMQACAAGDMLNAEFMLQQALQRAVGLGSDVLEAKLRNNLCIVCRLAGRSKAAEEHCRIALSKLTRRIGPKSALHDALKKQLAELSAAANAS